MPSVKKLSASAIALNMIYISTLFMLTAQSTDTLPLVLTQDDFTVTSADGLLNVTVEYDVDEGYNGDDIEYITVVMWLGDGLAGAASPVQTLKVENLTIGMWFGDEASDLANELFHGEIAYINQLKNDGSITFSVRETDLEAVGNRLSVMLAGHDTKLIPTPEPDPDPEPEPEPSPTPTQTPTPTPPRVAPPASISGGSSNSSSNRTPLGLPAVITPTALPTPPPPIFTDVGGDYNWAKNSIVELHEKGIITGIDGNFYEPERNITRAEFTKVTCGVFGFEDINTGLSFNDVTSTDWFFEFVLRSASAGIVNGYPNGDFLPGNPITREEMAGVIVRSLESKGYIIPVTEVSFADSDTISNWAKGYVSGLAEIGLVQGRDGNNFEPKANLTRAETAVVMSRTMTYLKDN